MRADLTMVELMRSVAVQRHRADRSGMIGWELRPDREQKEAILTAVIRGNDNLRLHYSEDPSVDMPGWSGHPGSGYVVPPGVDIVALVGFLYLGGWTLTNLIPDVSDLIESLGLDNIFTFMQTHALTVVVASFWDDREWTVAMRCPPNAHLPSLIPRP